MTTSSPISGNALLTPEAADVLLDLLQELRGHNIRSASLCYEVSPGCNTVSDIVVVDIDGTERNLMEATSMVAEEVQKQQIDLLDKFKECLFQNAMYIYGCEAEDYGTLSIDVERGSAELHGFTRHEDSISLETIKCPLSEVYSSPHPYYPDANYENVQKLLEEFASNGVTKIEVEYSGGGDEGCEENVTFMHDEAVNARPARQLEELHVDGLNLSKVIGSLLAKNHLGYENNMGGSGVICIDLRDRSLTHERKDNKMVQSDVALSFEPLQSEQKAYVNTPKARG